ncbi:ROK family protein [Thiomicrorhabdus cannonii]|uniref:ROK family protein n=1 Tax=Thiomicrorhabdus cannonii TaxID=2748011 RepID=UPI0015BB0B21|nr:ROK family protein [Thiomicrorhabdus cannonii]
MRLGVDLGGTKIEIIALDDKGAVCHQKRVDTPKGNYAGTLECIAALVEEADAILGQKGSLGVGIPGAVSHKTGRVKNANSTWLIGQDLQGDLQRRLLREVKLANDANCFALSEAMDGAAQGAEVAFGVIIGTGCGGGIVVNGRILNGVNAIGGEWGHNPLPWALPQDSRLPCYCGLNGCNETFLSGSGLQAHFVERGGDAIKAQQIVALARQGDEKAAQLMRDYYRWLAQGLASVINLIDPDVIVLGGGMSNIAELYEEVPKLWQQWVFSDRVDTRLVAPKYGDASGVRGAAWLW